MGYIVNDKTVVVPRNNKGILRYILPKNKKVYTMDLSIEEAVSALVGEYASCNDIMTHPHKEDIFDLYDQYLIEMDQPKCIRCPSPPRHSTTNMNKVDMGYGITYNNGEMTISESYGRIFSISDSKLAFNIDKQEYPMFEKLQKYQTEDYSSCKKFKLYLPKYIYSGCFISNLTRDYIEICFDIMRDSPKVYKPQDPLLVFKEITKDVDFSQPMISKEYVLERLSDNIEYLPS